MHLKTIILHIGRDPEHAYRFRYAVDLARRHDAHLEIAYLTQPAGMPAAITGRGASAAYMAEAAELGREHAAAVKKELTAGCAAAGISWTWEVVEGDHNHVLAERSLLADVVLVSQDHGVEFHDHVGLQNPSELIVMSACPVLVLPKQCSRTAEIRRVLIAWRDDPAAARAIRGARGALDKADKVYLLSVGRTQASDKVGVDDVAAYLDRQGIRTEPLNEEKSSNIADALLHRAEELEVDLMVMGAYSHTRWRELLLGGITSSVLRHQTVPLLLSH